MAGGVEVTRGLELAEGVVVAGGVRVSGGVTVTRGLGCRAAGASHARLGRPVVERWRAV